MSFRPISQLLKWTHSTHPSFELTRLHVESFSNNGQAIFQSESLPFTDQGTFYESSFLDLVPDLLDESYQVVLSMDYLTAPCGLDEPEIQLDRTYCYEVVDGYDELQSEYTFARRYGPIEPELHLNTTLCDVTSFDSRVAWRLEFDNTTSLTNSTPELTAFYPWLQPISPSGLIGDFSLVNLETGTSYPLVNGIFQLDTLFNLDTVRLELRGINQSCIQEPIEFRYGWDCAPYTNPIDDPCVAESLTCSVLSPPGVIDMQANPMAISAPLCDTMEWLEVEVFDAGLGAVYNLQLEVQLPPGMTIPNGVSQIAYPAESNNYLPVGDPQDLGNGLYRWILTEEVDTLQTFGLPGVNRAPENALSLRFKALTDCDFIAGSFALYSASAEEVCDRPTNSVAKIGEPMNIDGVTPPYTTTITTSTTGNPACTDSLQLEVRVNSLTPFGTADSLIIQLPPGIVYEDLSCTGSLPDCTPFVAGNLLLWVLPPGAQSLDLEIGLLGFQSLDCQDLTFPIYTTNTVNANCAALGQSCGLRVLTGSRTVAVGLDRPIFTISNFTATPIPGQEERVDLSFDLSNTGPANVDSIHARLYLDLDGDGQLSPGDLALNDFRFADLISNGSSVNLNILNQTIAPEDLCRLLLVIDPDDNCICVPASAPLQGPFEYQAVQSLSLCSGDTIMLGRPTLAGNTYQWESAEGLLCTDCATASYTRENPGFNPMTFPLYLNVINPDDCQLRFEYLVTVQPIPGIWSADSEICAGDTALLLASPGTNYQWQGPSIINPNQQSQAVSPMLTATYFVTITDASGCTGIDSAQVMVIESPIANAGENIQTCTGAEVQLSAEENPAYTYLWSPGFPALDDPTSPTPMVLTSSDQTFTLTVFNETCSATDEVEVSFFDGLDLQFTGPQSACRGDTIILELNGADQYLWQPSFIGMCQDAGCSVVQLALDADTEFTITATTDDGCIDTLMIDIEVLAAEVVEMAELNACEGQSVDLYGVLRDSPGTYCDTMPSASGCLEIRCTELTFTNTISTDESAAICFGDTLDFNGESYSSTGNYCITYTAAGGCDSVHCLDLMVYPEAELTISPEAPVIEKGESIQLNASSGLEDYRWTPEETLSCSDCPDPIADPLEDTRYIVTATDERECPASDTVLVRVVTICEAANLLIPDAFTANDNGKNDRFRIANLVDFAGTVSIEVYNRWGERVYFERGNEGWDGTFKGEPAPEAVYLYLIRAQCDGEDEQFYKGNVTLLR